MVTGVETKSTLVRKRTRSRPVAQTCALLPGVPSGSGTRNTSPPSGAPSTASGLLVKWNLIALSRLPKNEGRLVSLMSMVRSGVFGGTPSGNWGSPLRSGGKLAVTGRDSGVGAGGDGFNGNAGSRTQNWPLVRSPGCSANGRIPAPSGVPTRPVADLVRVAESRPRAAAKPKSTVDGASFTCTAVATPERARSLTRSARLYLVSPSGS